jgi:hypothetical protein
MLSDSGEKRHLSQINFLMDSGRILVRTSIKLSYQVTGILVALLWLFQASAVAGIYKWRDDQGKLHFTDSKAKIPLKYRENVQKFKGVVEPKPKEEAPPEEEQEELKSEEEPQAASQPPPPAQKPKRQFIEEEQAQLKETHDYLVKIRKLQVNLLNKGFTKSIGEDYIRIAPNLAQAKLKLRKKIRKTTVPSLNEARSYLKKSAASDRRERMDEEGFMERVEILKKRLEKAVPKLNEIIDKIKTDLDMKLVPHPILVDTTKEDPKKPEDKDLSLLLP